jgi:hypothetical protein
LLSTILKLKSRPSAAEVSDLVRRMANMASELREAVERGTATLIERDGQITGYATEVGFLAHSEARSNADLIALIAAASEFTRPGFLLPASNYEVFACNLANGLRLQSPMTYITTGLYSEPAGAYLASVLY